jgi:hypothetical protein
MVPGKDALQLRLGRAILAHFLAGAGDVSLLDEPLMGVVGDEGTHDRCCQHVWSCGRDDTP